MTDRRTKIRFYVALKKRIADPAWPEGKIPVDWLLHGAPTKHDPETDSIQDADAPGLATLTYGDGGSAYVADFDADPDDRHPDMFFAEIPKQTDEYIHLRVWRIRMSQLPSRHDLSDGTTTLIDLTKTQGLAEASDIVFFLKSCVVGYLVNRPGPAQNDVLRYLEDRTAVSIRFVLLHREDALDLVQGHLVTSVDVEVAVGHFEALANVTPEIGTAAKAVNTPGLRTIRVSFGAAKDERGKFWQWWQPRARLLVGLGREQVNRIEVGQAGHGDLAAQSVDLLSEVIGFETMVRLESGRTVDQSDARETILGGFNKHNDLIARAADGLNAVAENQRVERRKRASTSQGVGTVSS